jgi:hypothetical protein
MRRPNRRALCPRSLLARYSHTGYPEGSKVLGETTSVGAMNQRRIAASFTVIQRDPVNRACDISLLSPGLMKPDLVD